MSANSHRLGAILAILAIVHIQVSTAQFFQQQPLRNVPRTGSISAASSKAIEREVSYGPVELSKGVAKSHTVTKSNGGFQNGGLTSVSKSKAVSRGVELGGLDIGSTLTRSQTKTNGAVSKAVSHDLNVGKLNIGTSLSRDNLRNGIGLQRAPGGGLQLGLGALSLDLSRNNQPSNGALTQAQAQAQGLNAQAKANSHAQTQSKQYGKVGVTNTVSKSNAVSHTNHGQTSASTGGLAGGAASNGLTYGQGFRVRRTPSSPIHGVSSRQVAPTHVRQRPHVRSKRRAQFIPFAYPGSEWDRPKRQFNRPNFGFQRPGFGQPQFQNSNAQGLANNKNNFFQQQAGANTQSNQEINKNGFTQNNGASSLGSNLATDGSSGQVGSANVAQMNSATNGGSQSSNNAQSQALNFDANQQQAASSNAGTNKVTTANGGRVESNSGSQATNNNQFGSSSNIANTNSLVFREGNTQGSQADSSSQSIFQGNNGDNASANTGSNVTSMRGPNGFVSNSASSNASAVSQGGKGANAVASATASSSSSSGGRGGGGFTNAQGNAGAGGALANSGAFGNNFGAQGFANGQSGNRRAMKTGHINTSFKLQVRRNVTGNISLPAPESEADNPSTHQQHRYRYPAGSDNSSVEIFGTIDENERNGRTFDMIGDFLDSMTPRCVKPCTLDAYLRNICCETVVLVPPPNVCCQPHPMPPYLPPFPQLPGSTIMPQRPVVIVPAPTRPVMVFPTNPLAYPMSPSQCCSTCTTHGYYGPPPCVRYSMGPRTGPGRITLYTPQWG